MSPTDLQPLAARRDRFLAFAFAAADLLVEASADGVIEFATGAFHVRFGVTPESFVGCHVRKMFAPDDHSALELALSLTAMRGRLAPLIVRLADPAATPMVVSGLSLPDADGRLCLTVGRLPGLPSPATSEPASRLQLARAAELRLREGDAGSLGLLELEGWAATCGTLSAAAQRALQTEINEVLARLGGPGAITGEVADGRYGVLTETEADLPALAGGLKALLQSIPATAQTQVASAGISLGHPGLTGQQAARALRFALGRFAVGGMAATEQAGLNDGLADFIATADIRARSIRSTIAEGRFQLAFQPVVLLATRKVHHYEALLRPVYTPGSPVHTTQEFVTFAEAVGLSEELDWAVLQAAAAMLNVNSSAAVAVNISGFSMQSAAFRTRMMGLVLARKPSAGRLLVELTETADIEDVGSAAESVAQLRAAGIAVCIDDFGAGSAAFRYLREFQVDYVKVDGAYVRGALNNAREYGFLLSMVELANFVGAKVIAEMIETEAEADMMRDIGVEFGQGWLFGHPGTLPGSRTS